MCLGDKGSQVQILSARPMWPGSATPWPLSLPCVAMDQSFVQVPVASEATWQPVASPRGVNEAPVTPGPPAKMTIWKLKSVAAPAVFPVLTLIDSAPLGQLVL